MKDSLRTSQRFFGILRVFVSAPLLFGMLAGPPAPAAPPAPFADTDGDTYIVTLSGGGSLVVTQDDTGHPGSGPIAAIALSGTSRASGLKVVVKKGVTGDGRVSIGAITADASLGSIAATASDLVGAGIAIDGLATSVKLRSIANGATLTFGPSAKPKPLAIVTSEGIGNVTLGAPGSTLSITARGIAQATIEAAQVATLKTTGSSFSADVATPGKLVALSVNGGDVNGSHIDALAIGSIGVKRDKAGTGGSMIGSFIAAKTSIGAVIVEGGFQNSYLMAGANFGADRKPGGMGADSDTFGPGSIRSLIVGGNVVDSVVGAGLHPVDTRFGDLNDGTLGGKASKLGSVTIKGQLLGKVVIGAGLLPAMVSVNKAKFKPLTNMAFVSRAVRQLPPVKMVATPIDQTKAAPAALATSFLFSGVNAIQSGLANGALEMRRVAVLRGRVINRDGVAAPGVTIGVLGHAEFGTTFSREDGQFDLAVNGGGLLTVKFEAAGLMPVQRQIDTAALDFNVLGDVAMVGIDPLVSEITFGPAAPMQVHESSVEDDGEGARHALLIFQPGTTASLEMADGSTVPVADGGKLHIRATEFTVGPNGEKAMPAILPASSGFTYCVEYSADEATNAGATNVLFSQPVLSFVENFLGFPAGTTVPSGSFDRKKGSWVAGPSGVVVKIVGASAGMAELDVTGDGNADTGAALTALGITDLERAQLAVSYQVPLHLPSLWRVPVAHFSGWDSNWGFGPPPGAQPPKMPPPRNGAPPDDSDCCGGGGPGDSGYDSGSGSGNGSGGGGSGGDTPDFGVPRGPRTFTTQSSGGGNLRTKVQPQSTEVEIPISGSGLSLHYDSARVTGRAAGRQLRIPLSGAALPADVKGIEMEVAVAGRTFAQQFAAQTNQFATFEWDGRDAYGRTVQGRQQAQVRIGYVYDGSYTQTSAFGYNGNGIPITGDFTRRQVTLSQLHRVTLSSDFDARRQTIGGWTLDVHHAYDPAGRVLYLGDGSRRSADGLTATIQTVAGGGNPADNIGDGSRATNARVDLFNGGDTAFAPDGTMFVSEASRSTLRKVAPDGTITTICGQFGQGNLAGDGGPAKNALLNRPQGLASGPDGSLFIVDSLNNVVRRIAPDATGKISGDSIISTFAGGGASYLDNVPATQSSILLNQDPGGKGIAVSRDGTVFVVDNNDFGHVRRIGTDGMISNFAGGGLVNPPNAGDEGPATAARVVNPTDVAVDALGNVYIAAEGNVRKVTTDGIIHTVAGSPPNTGDSTSEGIPATTARIEAHGIAALADGSFYIAESGAGTPVANFRVRYVDAKGLIRTVAGTSLQGFGGDGGPPLQAQLDITLMLGLSPDSHLHISDNGNNRIRAIGSTLPDFTAANIDVPSEDGGQLYRFDPFGKHLATFDTFTGATRFTFGYDADGQLVSVTDAHGNVLQIQRAASGAPTAIIAPFGQKTTLTADASGSLASVRDPAGGAWTLASTPDGLVTGVTDPVGKQTSFSYDANGRVTQNAGPDAATVTLDRTEISAGYFVTGTNTLGAAHRFQVETLDNGDDLRTNTDAANLAGTERRGDDGSLKFTAPDATIDTTMRGGDPRFGLRAPIDKAHTFTTPGGKTLSESTNRATTLGDPQDPLSLTAFSETFTRNGRTSTTNYDPPARAFDFTTPLNRHAGATLNASGDVAGYQVPGFAAVALGYDAHGRLTSTTQGAGATARTASASYNSSGLVAALTDPLTRVTSFTHNAAGDLTQVKLPGNRTVKFTRDALGRATGITPPGRPAHLLGYTDFGALASYTAPDAGGGAPVTMFEYRADRRLSRITHPGGETVAFGYDPAGRLVTRTTAAGATMFSYHPATGSLATITAPGGNTLAFTYDGSEMLSETWSGTVAGSVSRTIDNDLRAATQSVNGANPLAFTYDDDGDVTAVGALTFTRDAQTGFVTGATIGGITETYGYNEFGEVTHQRLEFGGNVLFEQTLTRDALGRITQNVETTGGGTTTIGYGYDDAGRLGQVTRSGGATVDYAYDANGNRTSAGGKSASFDAQDRLTIFDGRALTYNDAGDLQTKPVTGGALMVTYDVLGNLTQAMTPAVQVDYLIDAGNRRIGRKAGAVEQHFLYDGALRIAAELDASNTLVSRFIYAGGGTVPDYLIFGGANYRVITDTNGSVRLVVNAATGAIAQRLDYDAFGVVAADSAPGLQPFGFAGGLYDPDTKLVRFGSRDYDAETGRWTAKDPALFKGGDTNLYAYVGNDPINGRDATGLKTRTPPKKPQQKCESPEKKRKKRQEPDPNDRTLEGRLRRIEYLRKQGFEVIRYSGGYLDSSDNEYLKDIAVELSDLGRGFGYFGAPVVADAQYFLGKAR